MSSALEPQDSAAITTDEGAVASKLEQVRVIVNRCTSKFPDVQVITCKDIKELRDAPVLDHQPAPVILIDVRDTVELKVSMIPGAISQVEFEQLDKDSIAEDTILAPYCTVGFRSGVYAEGLIRKGFTNVRNSEGIVMWTHDSEEPLVQVKKTQESDERGGVRINTTATPIKVVHTYGAKWDLCREDYESIQYTYWEQITSSLGGVLRYLWD